SRSLRLPRRSLRSINLLATTRLQTATTSRRRAKNWLPRCCWASQPSLRRRLRPWAHRLLLEACIREGFTWWWRCLQWGFSLFHVSVLYSVRDRAYAFDFFFCVYYARVYGYCTVILYCLCRDHCYYYYYFKYWCFLRSIFYSIRGFY